MALTEPAVLVLTALVGESRHGYALISEVQELSGGRVTLSVGTLYGLLDRLTGEGLIARDREEVHAGRTRRYYRLTDDGAAALAAEAERLAQLAAAASGRLRAAGAV
ncbi:Transcriptional regulator PadR-like family protein [Quadrisphaera granulorum]|uniref:PadR family transcriptional regulator n=1 Tax=Quadrisphaera granulorum TaxID=317664 RepID=A0A316A9P3_9ACTN|nr:PadR family transcriptional regulator [Quadrisphaera granulorum]PWJ54222.1 PadR family transcriptional regulator [Quadrisphaera granulorum]SZE96361.1 Transcriptional regulator PadR-like family protein [Quadrisphaera granulorum]